MSTSTKPPSVPGTVIAAILVAVPWLALGVQLLVIVPRMKKTFDEFGLQLPQLTKTVIIISNSVNHFWWVAIPSGLAVLLLMVAGIAWLRHFLRYSALLPTAFLLAGLVAANTTVAFALRLPLVKLQEGLAR